MKTYQLQRRSLPMQVQLPASLPPLLRQLYATRGITDTSQLARDLVDMHDYQLFAGIDLAVKQLYGAMVANKRIVIVGDLDVDGATSTALAVLALRNMGYSAVDYCIPNRFEYSYGLSVDVIKDAQIKGAELIITVDNGISSLEGVAFARQQGIEVIITDHHLPGDKLPDAAAIINPNLANCDFPSKSIAGVGVIFYFMIALRAHLRAANWFEQRGLSEYNLANLLDLVALGTVADVVTLDKNNRLMVHQGIMRIRANRCRIGISALLSAANKNNHSLTAKELGFVIAPRLNAAGRLDDMSLGVELLLTDDNARANVIAQELDALNQIRKSIEKVMESEASVFFEQITGGIDALPCGIALYHPEWHQGVIGILAARIKARFYRPVISFAGVGDGTLKGSARSITGIHIRDILERLDTLYPDLLLTFGGHAMAAGLSIKVENFDLFQRYFNALVEEIADPALFDNNIITDGEITEDLFSIQTAELLHAGGPWGQGFPEPVFDGRFRLLHQQIVGHNHLKIMVEPLTGGPLLNGIVFNVDRAKWPDLSVKDIELIYSLDINEFRGKRQLQLIVDHLHAY